MPAPFLAEQAGGMTYRKLLLDRPGDIDGIRLVSAPVPGPGANQVQIAVRAYALNFGDLLCVRGLYPHMPDYPFTPGFEVSGVVVAVGADVRNVRVGDEVIALADEAMGGQATLLTCDAWTAIAKPSALSFEQACALPAASLTMIDAFRKAQLRRGERILIQSAAGGTGLIAVQLAGHYGAEIYATAGSQGKLAYLADLGVEHRINYLEADFEKEIARLTDGRGIDVVINTVGGDAIQKGMRCLAPGGRYIEIAMTALKSARAIDLSILNSNQSFYSIDMRKLGSDRPELVKEYFDELMELVTQGIITPTISRVFPFDQFKEAHRWLDNRQNIGKVVVSIPEHYQLQVSDFAASPGPSGDAVKVNTSHSEPIAIIGVSGRFAGSETVEQLWSHLANGNCLIEEVSRWQKSQLYPEGAGRGDQYCLQGSFLSDVECFDPLFFRISGAEATYMDPQQRLFLEEAWRALEDAGYAGAGMQGRRCGVYVGCANSDYNTIFDKCDSNTPAQAFWGNASSIVPARIAYYLDLQGPAIAIDTACSSSLVAMHMACQGLWSGETEMALAGGVFVQCTPAFFSLSNHAGMLSPTGRCHTFDAQADGFVPGEGVGAVVLKRLSRALADGDNIHGVIRGSAINQDGMTNGITAPSALAQERLEREVYDRFSIRAEQIQMVEAHGTGTRLGDPIEYRALTNAFRKDTDKVAYCAIGSIKTNIGHAATAAGMAGVIKVLLSLRHKQIPPSLNFQAGNPNIEFDSSPFYVNTELRDWEVEGDAKRCAAVSSFGFSGTNAHMVIEEWTERPSYPRQEKAGYLIVLSARGSQQLRQQAQRLVKHCDDSAELKSGGCELHLAAGTFTLLPSSYHGGARPLGADRVFA